MKLTTQKLEQMRSVDIGAVAAESLPDVSGMTFDNALSRKERISRFLQTVKNPYCFCIGGVGVKIEFAESGPSLQDKLTDFLLRQRSGCNFGYSSFCFFETKCPEVEASLLSSPDRVII